MKQFMAIGDFTFKVDDTGFTPRGIGWSVSGLKSARKVDKKAGEKQDDATTTDKGREARDVKIKFSWSPYDEASASVMGSFVELYDASAPKPPDPPPFAYTVGFFDIAKAKRIANLKIEKTNGPEIDFEKGVATYEIEGSSFVAKPKQSAGAGTPQTGQKFVLDQGQSPGSTTVQNFGGIPGNTVTIPGSAPAKPAVKP